MAHSLRSPSWTRKSFFTFMPRLYCWPERHYSRIFHSMAEREPTLVVSRLQVPAGSVVSAVSEAGRGLPACPGPVPAGSRLPQRPHGGAQPSPSAAGRRGWLRGEGWGGARPAPRVERQEGLPGDSLPEVAGEELLRELRPARSPRWSRREQHSRHLPAPLGAEGGRWKSRKWRNEGELGRRGGRCCFNFAFVSRCLNLT